MLEWGRIERRSCESESRPACQHLAPRGSVSEKISGTHRKFKCVILSVMLSLWPLLLHFSSPRREHRKYTLPNEKIREHVKELKGANVCKASLKPREKHWQLASGIIFRQKPIRGFQPLMSFWFRQIGIPPNMVLSFRLELPKSYLSSLAWTFGSEYSFPEVLAQW